MLWLPVTFLALFASAQGRAVNISNTWVLPEEGFPVFYRYFRDRISWYEADAVCQFHHANLVTVDTTAQYDAVRAYLKELDIASAVWVGLIRSNPDGDFTWTDYRGLSGEGYWSAAPDARAAPLCAAADPAADYRWEARACGGPSVASFICELPVPQWALGNEGCMVRALPALTALYLPESAAVQLTADCGLAGVKRVQCTGNVKREELLRDLSCSDENDPSSTLSLTSTSTIWPATDTTLTDQEMTTEDLSTEDNIVTESKETSNTGTQITQTIAPYSIDTTSTEAKTSMKQNLNTDYIRLALDKSVAQIHTNNIISNDIPLHDNPLDNQSLQKIENDNNYKHRLLHDEMTRLGNLDTIFTQPTDHFVPPLVMAKARISDDMTVLSLQEKHAQQIAEQRLHKHNKLVEHTNIMPSQTTIPLIKVMSSTNEPVATYKQVLVEQDLTPGKSVQNDSVKKDVKSSVPKKYVDKNNNLKGKIWRTIDYKTQKSEKIGVLPSKNITSTTTKIEDHTTKIPNNSQKDSEEDSVIDLTVIIKEPGTENDQEIFYSNHSNRVPKFEPTINVTDEYVTATEGKYSITDKPYSATSGVTDESSEATSTITLSHEIIKITVLNDKTTTENSTPLVFEVSTMIPVLNNKSVQIKDTQSYAATSEYPAPAKIITKNLTEISSDVTSLTTHAPVSKPETTPAKEELTTLVPLTIRDITVENKDNIASSTIKIVTAHGITNDAISASTLMPENELTTEDVNKLISTTDNLATKFSTITVPEKTEMLNHTEHIEDDQDQQEPEIDDYQSPLLSAANEPLHRPSRSRRPQPPNRMKKFNPFRMLG